jgi:sugar/nucleoside kinase (ribokinase family)
VGADVVCLGILVADVIARPVDRLPKGGTLGLVDEITLRGGGSALSTASTLVRLGVQAAVAGKVGADAFGDFLLGLIGERGVDGSGVLVDEAVPTSATVVLVGRDGERAEEEPSPVPQGEGHGRGEEPGCAAPRNLPA